MGALNNRFIKNRVHPKLTTTMQPDSSQISPLKVIHDLARRNKIHAEYQLEKESGPAHAKTYTVRLRFGDKEYTGADRSIKLAQRVAAQAALDDRKHLSPNNTTHDELKKHESPTVALNTWATQQHVPTRYALLNEEHLPPTNTHPQTIFYYRLFVGDNLYFDGHGSSRQRARTLCAYHALDFIQQNQTLNLTLTFEENHPKSGISLMYERARQLGLPIRMEYNEPMTITYNIGEIYSITGTGPTKHAAKENAAEKMLELLPLPDEKMKSKSTRKSSNQHRKFIEQKGSNDYSLSEEINPITRLYQVGRAREQKVEFIQIETTESERSFHFRVKIGESDSADGYGKSKKVAKRLAAESLLSKVNFNLLESNVTSLPPAPKKGLLKREENSNRQQEKKHVHFLEDQTMVVQQRLSNACEKLDIRIQYEDLMMKDQYQYQSILSLTKGDRLLAKFRGNGFILADAQENAAKGAWKNLHDLFKGAIPTSIQ